METYLVATNSAYTVIVRAKNEDSAVKKAQKYYETVLGYEWGLFATAYKLEEYLKEEGNDAVLEVN